MWEEIYERYYPELLRYAAAATGNEAEAQDVAQEVFLKALQSADIFLDLGPSQRRAWLFRALKNLMCDRYRRAKLENTFLETLEPDAAAPDPRMQEIENQLLLARLSPEDRMLFHLRYEEGYNASELAKLYHVPAGTIRARLSRMRKYLKQLIEE